MGVRPRILPGTRREPIGRRGAAVPGPPSRDCATVLASPAPPVAQSHERLPIRPATGRGRHDRGSSTSATIRSVACSVSRGLASSVTVTAAWSTPAADSTAVQTCPTVTGPPWACSATRLHSRIRRSAFIAPSDPGPKSPTMRSPTPPTPQGFVRPRQAGTSDKDRVERDWLVNGLSPLNVRVRPALARSRVVPFSQPHVLAVVGPSTGWRTHRFVTGIRVTGGEHRAG